MYFITGATGTIGGEFLRALMQQSSPAEIALLVRERKGVPAAKRAADLMRELSPHSNRHHIRIVEGDTSLPRFGLGEQEFQKLSSQVSKVLHCAASTDLSASLEQARADNVRGTQNAVDLALRASKAGKVEFFHVSTAYVAGDTRDSVTAAELRLGGPFRNYYEQSKAEAEALVRNLPGEVPFCIFRPSVVVGHSLTGRTSSFNVMYVPARFFVTGLISVLPAVPTTPFDVVPVDYVGDAMSRLVLSQNRTSNYYHLCAGVGRESNPLEVVQWLIRTVNMYRAETLKILAAPSWFPPELLETLYHSICAAKSRVKNLERLVIEHLGMLKHVLPFLPYMISNPQFITAETERDLGFKFAHPPLFQTYAENIFKYCLDTNWGRLPQPSPS